MAMTTASSINVNPESLRMTFPFLILPGAGSNPKSVPADFKPRRLIFSAQEKR
jgi:hypothetical protein